MDHLSIYESGIVNPYRNKNDPGKSYFCPPNAAGLLSNVYQHNYNNFSI